MKRNLAQTPRGPIEYCLEGRGPVALVLHGTSCDCSNGLQTDALVDAGFSVLAPSRPGYGHTPLDTGRSVEQAAGAIIALLEERGISSCAVIAVSGGGPTGIALAGLHPGYVRSLVMFSAVSDTAHRPLEPGYSTQRSFYGPLHPLVWALLGGLSRLSPRAMALQTLRNFSLHDPEAALGCLGAADIQALSRFYRRSSSRAGALNDLAHSVDPSLLRSIRCPTLVIHSRMDRAVPFHHAEHSLRQVAGAHLCEAGVTGHFVEVGPDAARIQRLLVQFLKESLSPPPDR